jgi:hypothetical protein
MNINKSSNREPFQQPQNHQQAQQNQYSQYNQSNQPQMQQHIQQLNLQFANKEKQYQEQLQLMHGKMSKYEEYLKILMAKYNELKEDRDLMKERFQNPSNASNAIDDKKRELIRLSQELQAKIDRLEQLNQNNSS